MNDKFEKALEELGTKYYEKGVDFKGYEVYIPRYSSDVCIGYPLVILKKGEEIRISTVEEALEYLRLTNPDDED